MDAANSMTWKQRIGRWLIPRLPVTKFAFDLFRLEFARLRVNAAWTLSPVHWVRLAQLRRLRGIYVNAASAGFLLDGFVHLDLFGGAKSVIRWDCSRSLPFANESCRGIRVEHFVEHIEPKDDLPSLLRDCLRVLVAGGVLRIVVPDAERYIRAYARDDLQGFAEIGWKTPFPDDLPTRMDAVNHTFHQWHEHRWGYDFETLTHRLRQAGFSKVEKMSFQQSLDPILAQDRPVHAPYSLYVDAVKLPVSEHVA